MFITKSTHTRQGIILLIVLAMLTLFAIIGVSFVMYAGSMATSARNAREAESPLQPNMEPELLLSWFLSQLIFDADDVNGVYSAMRGHSLARTMFGQDSDITQSPTGQTVFQTKPNNTVSYSGIGRVRTTPFSPTKPDEWDLVNYQFFTGLPGALPLRDPERYYGSGPGRGTPNAAYPPNSYIPFNVSYTYPDLNNMFLGAVKAGGLTFQYGTPPQTYSFPPGVVLAPSFHRPALFGSLRAYKNNPWGLPVNPNWGDGVANPPPEGRYRILRPRPIDNGLDATGNPLFPYPEDEGGDVKNLLGSPGTLYLDNTTNPPTYKLANNDSSWMDLGAPVMVAPDGSKYKALFAPFITDLDNRINLNVHGNMRGSPPGPTYFPNTKHASNSGWGSWEVNLQRVLDQPQLPPVNPPLDEWTSLFRRTSNPTLIGRYGGADQSAPPPPIPFHPFGYPVTQPYVSQTATPGTAPHYYAPVDLDGCDEKNSMASSGSIDPAFPVPRPSAANNWQVTVWPGRPNGYEWRDNTVERMRHPMLFNFFNPQKDKSQNPVQYDSIFPISNMEALLRYGETNSPGLTSDLYRMAGKNFDPATSADPSGTLNPSKAAARRGEVTTHSFGFDRAGVTPWMWDPNGATPTSQRPYGLFPDSELNVAQPFQFPQGANSVDAAGSAVGFGPVPFPPLADRAGNVPPGSEFSQRDWRAKTAAVQRVDLNRYLTPYPIDLASPAKRFDLNNTLVKAQFERAQLDRQLLAKDIYVALIAATGAYNPAYPTPDPKLWELRALRWLAQLAVNMVDQIDVDDIMTPLDWINGPLGEFTPFGTMLAANPALQDEVTTNYVLGTELPRVVVNEAYAQFKYESPADKINLHVSVWAELHNTSLPGGPNVTGDTVEADPHAGRVWLQWPNEDQANYRIILCKPDVSATGPPPQYTHLRRTDNTLGTPWPLKPADPGLVYQPPLASGIQHCVVNKFNANQYSRFIEPAIDQSPNGGAYSDSTKKNLGFYLVGPATEPFPSNDQTYQWYPKIAQGDPAMTYKVTVNTEDTPDQAHRFIVLLQRLANPYLPHAAVGGTEPDSGTGSHPNPYVTVDLLDTYYLPASPNPIHNATPAGGPPEARWSVGRAQPFAAHYAHLKKQAPTGYPNGQVKTTFHRHNGIDIAPPLTLSGANTLQVQGFDWLYHLDRQLSSPMELLNVSGFKPHELLQQFRTGNRNEHLVPWFDQTTRLYRVFEFLHTHNRASGVAAGGRLPGLVNLNTIWDEEILQALCDSAPLPLPGSPPHPNYFNADDVRLTFERLLLLRSGGAAAPYLPGTKDRPFLGMAAGYSMGDGAAAPLGTGIDEQHPPPGQPGSRGIGINDTIFRTAYQVNGSPLGDRVGPEGGWGKKTAPKYPRLFQISKPGGMTNFDQEIDFQHPYFQNQMLTKMFNNVTTRSNVFAVWVTVGFFKVENDTTRPVKLGAEIGKVEGRNIRHRFFTIVDRSNLTLRVDPPSIPGGPPVYRPGEAPIYLSGSVFKPETMADPNNPPPLFTISGAEYAIDDDGVTPILTGYYEGIRWKIHGGLPLVFGYGTDAQGQPAEVPVTVRQINNFDPVTGAPPSFTVNRPSDTKPYFTPRSIPFLIAMMDRQGQAIILGNPGPQSRFNPRDYPWIVRHISIIQ